ncbi:MAG TPA: fibronectin type III-like domain-contianing protein, partial [Rhizomicrobium sp.]
NSPLFPIGHGLGYGAVALSNLRFTPDGAGVQVDAINRGAMAAEETVFLFTHQRVTGVTRPVMELRGFEKIRLTPSQQGTVTLPLPAFNGPAGIFVGLSSEELLSLQRP